jgi:hypothetical protein
VRCPSASSTGQCISMPEGTGLTEPRNRCSVEYLAATASEMPCLEHGVSVGRRGTVDPKIACLNRGFCVRHRETRWSLEGTASVPKDGLPGDGVSLAGG